MRRVGIIGAGRIATPVIAELATGAIPGWTLAGVLARSARTVAGVPVEADPGRFFGGRFDLIVEAAGPEALRFHALAALARADVWSVGAAALADPVFRAAVEDAGREHGHRVRLIAPFPAIEVASLAASGDLAITVSRRSATTGLRFAGAVEDAARQLPDETNFAVAAALAGPGLSRTRIGIVDAGPEGEHRLTVTGAAPHGTYGAAATFPQPGGGALHPVAAALIAALKREAAVIW